MRTTGVSRFVLLMSAMLLFTSILCGSSHADVPVAVGHGFIENKGQWPDEVLFLYEAPGTAVWLTRDGIVIDRFSEAREEAVAPKRGTIPRDLLAASTRVRGTVLRTRFMNRSASVSVEGRLPLSGTHNFLIGESNSKSYTGARHFSEVWYRGLYDGIDIVFRCEKETGLKYDAVIAPGADYRRIQMRYEGALGLALTQNGDLRIATGAGDLFEDRPVVFQERAGRRVPVEASYRLADQATLSFAVGKYDPSLPLVIDPRLSWSTFLGGSGTDTGLALAAAPDGGIFVTGFTNSSAFPTTVGVYDRTANGLADAFVSKFDAAGRLLFSTLIGGSNNDFGQALVSDALGNLYIAGYTASFNFPKTPTAFDTSYGGGDLDVFVAKLAADGSALLYSTYLGGAGYDAAYGVVLDAAGNAVVAGFTSTSTFPTTPGSFDPSYNGGYEGFITTFNSGGTGLVQSTFLGGSGDDLILSAALGPTNDQLILGGSTDSGNFPVTPFAYDTTINGAQDGFVARFILSDDGLSFCTFIGGSSMDYGYAVCVDELGRASFGGETESFDFPLSPGAFDAEMPGGTDGFVTKLNETGTDIVFSTYLGGNESYDLVQGLVSAPNGAVLATGATLSPDFPVTSGLFGGTPYAGGLIDAFVTQLSKGGDAAIYSTCLGGIDGDAGFAILLRPDARVLATGYTASADYPTTNGAYDASWNGGFDTFVTALPVIVVGDVNKMDSAGSGPSAISLSVTSPARRAIDARVGLARRGSVAVDLIDVSGRLVVQRRFESLNEGVSDIQIDVTDAGRNPAAGVYYLRVTSGAESASRRVLLLR
jgi:hypothetical protein